MRRELRDLSYDGFISYSHEADGRLAPEIQQGLGRVARPWYRRRVLHVFRDDTSLAVSPELWGSIAMALDESRYLIVLASHPAAASTWVNREIEYWLGTKPISTVLPVLTGGEWTWDDERRVFSAGSTALPPALAAAFTEEPRHLDLRWAHDENAFDARSARFRLALGELAAPMRGMSKDELMGEDLRQHRRTIRLAWTVAAVLVVLLGAAVIASVVAVGNADRARRNEARAEEQASIATSRQLAAEARTYLEDDLDLALLLAVTSHQERPTVESRAVLVDALGTAPKMLRYLHGGGEPLLNVAPGVDPSQQLAVDAAGNVRRWDLNGATAGDLDLGLNPSEPGRAVRVAVRPHHDEVAAARPEGLSIWRAADGQWRRLDWAPPVLAEGALAFSDDGQFLAATRDDGRVVILNLDAEDTYLLDSAIDDTTGLSTFGFAFSPDKSWMAATFGDGGVAVVDLSSGEVRLLRQQYGHTERVAFSPDSRTLALAAAGGQVKLVSLPGLEETILRPVDPEVTEFTGLLSDVFPLVFSPSGSTLLVGGPDGAVHHWSLPASGDSASVPARVLPLSRSGISELAFADASTLLVADQSGTIEQWDLGAAESFGTQVGPAAEAQTVTVSASGDLVAVGGCDQSAVSDLGEGGVGCSDGVIVVAPTTGGPATTIHAHPDFVDALTFTADGSAIISGGRDGTIVRSELNDGAPRTLADPGGSVTDIALSPDGATVASSNFNGAVLLTSVDTGQTDVLQPAGDTSGLGRFEWMSSVAFTPDGAALYGGSTDGRLRRWSLPSAPVEELADLGAGNRIADLAVSLDGTSLAVVTAGTVRWLDTASGRWSDEPPIEGASGAVAFSPDGRHLAYSTSGGLGVRDLESRRLVGEPWRPASSPYDAVTWGGLRGDPVLAMTDANGATWWRTGDDHLVRAACARANRGLGADERTRFLLEPSATAGACTT